MESVFLSTYHLRARYKRADGFTMMGQFNGSNDLFPLLVEFLTEIFETPVQVGNDEDQNTTLNLTLSEPPNIRENERVVYGYFDVGVSGQEISVKNRHSKALVFKGDRDNHSLNRDLFFYFKLPYKSTAGYVIFQKKSKFGIKTGFSNLFKKWIQQKGYHDSLIFVNPILSGQVFNNMLNHGHLKKVNFIVNHVPNDIKDFYSNDENPSITEGNTITTIQSRTGLSNNWINFARRQYFKPERKTIVEYDGADGEKEYEEIQFEIEHNGRTKTFYAKKRDRTVPDIDVTVDIDKDQVTGQPLLESLLQKCKEIIEDTFEIRPNV